MSGKFARLFDGTTTSIPATTPTVSPGDFLTDYSGTTPGMWRCQVSGGVNTWVQVGEPYTPPAQDVITLTTSSTGAGNRTLTFTVTQGGSAAVSRGLVCGLEAELAISPTALTGSAILLAVPNLLHFIGRASAGGVFAVTLEGQSGDSVAYNVQTNGPTGATLSGSATIP